MSRTVSQRACYFRLGEQRLAFGSEHLRQIVTVPNLTRVPRVGPELLGLFSVRGAVLPLIDLRPLLSLPASPLPTTATAALIEYEGHQLAFYLEEVFGFYPYKSVTGTSSAALEVLSSGTVTHQDWEAALIDVTKVMSALERQLVPA